MPEPIVALNEESLKADLRELVRRTVEDILNGLLEEETGDLVGAERYERTAGRGGYRAGHYDRSPTTSSGEVNPHAQAQGDAVHHGDHRALPAPRGLGRGGRDRGVPRGRLHQAHRGRLRDLWGPSVSAAAVSNLNEKAFASVEERRNRPLERACPCACADGIQPKRSRLCSVNKF